MKFFILLSLIVFVFSAEKTFQFGEMIKGEWEIEKHVHVNLKENSTFVSGFLNISSGALPDVYIGLFKESEETIIQTKM